MVIVSIISMRGARIYRLLLFVNAYSGISEEMNGSRAFPVEFLTNGVSISVFRVMESFLQSSCLDFAEEN